MQHNAVERTTVSLASPTQTHLARLHPWRGAMLAASGTGLAVTVAKRARARTRKESMAAVLIYVTKWWTLCRAWFLGGPETKLSSTWPRPYSPSLPTLCQKEGAYPISSPFVIWTEKSMPPMGPSLIVFQGQYKQSRH